MQRKRRSTLSIVTVRTRPGDRSRGLLLVGQRAIPVVLGRAGIRANKREGDGATPRGGISAAAAVVASRPGAAAPHVAACTPDRPRPGLVRGSAPTAATTARSGARPMNQATGLWREDRLYDLIVEIDHNTRPRVAGRGSAVFLHVARPDRSPTAGCVAMGAGELRRLLAQLKSKNENQNSLVANTQCLQ